MTRILFLVAIMIALTGCGPSPETIQHEIRKNTFPVKVKVDGREIDCIVFVGYNKGGISCDW